MTAPRPSAGIPSRAPAVGDRRGLTAAGGVAVALLLGTAGGAVDVLTGSGLRIVFAVAFVLGCLIAALTVHREDLLAVVVMPPLVYVVLVLVAAAVEGTPASGGFLTRQAIELVNALVRDFPVLMTATGAAGVVALLRFLADRR